MKLKNKDSSPMIPLRKSRTRFLRLFAFYPFLLPVWQESYFTAENTAYRIPVQIRDESLRGQKDFFFAIPDAITRSRIVVSLNGCENPGMQAVLEEMLSKEKHHEVLADVLGTMVEKKVQSSNIPVLKEMMRSEIPACRAFSACLYLDGAASPEAVFEMLQKEDSPFVSNLAWSKLLERKDICTASKVASLHSGIPSFQRPQLLKLLASISGQPENETLVKDAAEKGSIEEKIAVVVSLAARPACADALLAKFAEFPDARLRREVARSAASPGRLAVLIKLSSDPESEVRRLAVLSLAGFGTGCKDAVEAIIARLSDEELLVRNDAEDRLLSLEIGPEYLSLIRDGPLKSEAGVASATRVLGERRYKEASEDIRAVLLVSKVVEVRRRSLVALGHLEHNSSARDCASFAGDKDDGVRRAAAFALGQFKEKETFEAVVKLAEDKVQDVSAEALFAIFKTGDVFFADVVLSSLKRVKEHYLIRSAAVKAAAGIGVNSKEIVKALRRAALDKTIPTDMGPVFDMDQVRGGAAWALADIALRNGGFAGEARGVLDVLQTPIEKQSEKVSSSEFLIDCARQAQAYLEGRECGQSEITPSRPNLVARPAKDK